MTWNQSTGFNTKILGASADTTGDGFTGIFNDAELRIYSGSRPTSADAAPSGTLLGKVTKNGDGTAIDWAAPSAGTVTSVLTDVLRMTGLADGTAAWARLCDQDDDNSSSTSLPRLDGLVARSGADVTMSSLSIVTDRTYNCDPIEFSA